LQSGIVTQFVFEQFDVNRNTFKGLSFEQFKNKIDGSDVYFNSFQKYIYSNGLEVKLDNKLLAKRYLLAEFARQLYGDDLYYKILLVDDAMIKVVLNKN
jgi:carboxyl-terminal processing protease